MSAKKGIQLNHRKRSFSQSDYIRAGGMTVAHEVGGVVTWLHPDHLGSNETGTDSTGAISWRETHTPFGEVINPTSANDNEAAYTGHIRDSATGLNYMQARYQDPVIGRFLSIDPVGFTPDQPFMFNRYAYVGNDPINAWDPTGEATCADPNCDTAFIDKEVIKGAAPIDSAISGNPEADTADITFVNDDPNGASPNQPVTSETALMVEGAVRNSEASQININSTTGGHASNPNSRHNQKRGIDINRVNGDRVDDPNNVSNVTDLQNAFAKQDNIRENFGPSFQTIGHLY